MNSRASLFIDIEGFGQLYATEKADSLWGLVDLMQGVQLLGNDSKRLGISRIFAHQFGDGFLIIEDTNPNIGNLVSLAVALHQFVLVKAGHFCASAVERGELADVVGCYPKTITDAMDGKNALRLGDGLMTVTPVMGTALIRSYGLLKRLKGAVLVLPSSYRSDLPAGIVVTEEKERLYVNWLVSSNATIAAAKRILRIASKTEEDLRKLFAAAVARNKPKPDWVSETSRFLVDGQAPAPQK